MNAPVGVALIICDSFYRDVPGGKPALIGLFNNITAAQFPARHSRLCVYASVTEVRERTKVRLDLVHSETEAQVVNLPGPPMDGVSPLQIIDMNFDLRGPVFPTSGLYFLRLWGNDHIVLQRPITLIEAPTKKKEDSK